MQNATATIFWHFFLNGNFFPTASSLLVVVVVLQPPEYIVNSLASLVVFCFVSTYISLVVVLCWPCPYKNALTLASVKIKIIDRSAFY